MRRERLPCVGAFAPHRLQLPLDTVGTNVALKAELLEQVFEARQTFFVTVANESHVSAQCKSSTATALSRTRS